MPSVPPHQLSQVDPTTHQFIEPKRCILKPQDVRKWEMSPAYADLMKTILWLNDCVAHRAVSSTDYVVSDNIKSLLTLLETLSRYVDETPAVDQPARFGNRAYRDWSKKLADSADEILDRLLPAEGGFRLAKVELKPYLLDSFGNCTRIDYGTGHELNFIIVGLLLFKIGFLQNDDGPAFILRVFGSYLTLCRKLQVTYRMEPAGSHGVWCLDDFQFLVFLFGSSQLQDHNTIFPSNFPEPNIYDLYYEDYIFLGAIRYITQVKTGPFAEHSNQLWNISGVPGWSKANQGLIKMYKGEVLCKFPIVQHIVFGSLFTLEKPTAVAAAPAATPSQ